jgi:hypothetical protein
MDYGQYEGLTTDQICEKNPGWNLFDQGALGESVEQIGEGAPFLHQVHSLEERSQLFLAPIS